MKLDQVLGFTVTNNSAFDCDPGNGIVAYPAGCVTVIYNVLRNRQFHLVNPSRKTITSLAMSTDGRYLVTGECGHDPCARVWNVSTGQQVAESSGHKFGINCVAFSPNGKYVVSIGSQHDMMVFVWDWKNDVKIASNKVSCKVKAISFTESGEYFVTVGNRHVKFWYLQYSSKSSPRKMDSAPLLGRSAILGDQRNNYFCDVACGKGESQEKTFAIARAGLLCEFNNRRLLDKWVELRTSTANCLSVGHTMITVGCADGIIRCFNPTNLHFICTLPRPHTLGIDIAKGCSKKDSNGNSLPSGSPSKYPNTIAITLDESNKKITSIYSDHSMYVWNIKDFKRIGKSRSFLYHSACIWGVDVYPSLKTSAKQLLPPGTFFTCSSDDTVRIWSLDSLSNATQSDSYVWRKNIFSQDLLKVLYMDPNLTHLCDPDLNTEKNEKDDLTFDGKNGVRCIKVSPDGRHLACGDRLGNIRVYDFASLQEITKIEAHDAEVLCIEYSPQLPNGKYLMASASRDRLILVFDVSQQYSFIQILPDHSSSVTSIKFILDHDRKALQLISCGADKSVIFRKYNLSSTEDEGDENVVHFQREHHVAGKTTLYDMDIDQDKRCVLTACQDRALRVYSAENGKSVQTFDGSLGNEGTLIKISVDPANLFVATSCTDKSMHIFKMASGECMTATNGHSELITGLKFSFNGRHLISVSGDGCIFIWKLPFEMANSISARLGLPPVPPEKPANILNKSIDRTAMDDSEKPIDGITSPSAMYRFNVKNLPPWAKKQIAERPVRSQDGVQRDDLSPSNGVSHPQPKGKWAQRMESSQNLVVKSYLNSDAVISYPQLRSKQESPYMSEDGSHSKEHSPLSRARHLTDSSSASGSWQREDEEEVMTTDSGDLVYYPQNDSFRGSSFEIRENNESEMKDRLRRFRRTRSNLGRYGSSGLMPSVSVPNFNELHSDDDESEHHGSERGQIGPVVRNPLYISTENLERLDKREKFLKSNFEMYDKDTEAGSEVANLNSENRSSISGRYLSKSNNSASTPTNDRTSTIVIKSSSTLRPPVSKKREELTKAISEARKKLETLGWRESSLNSSKSVANLREIGDVIYTPQKSSSIRRSISLSDLSIAPQRKFPVNTLSNPSDTKNSTPLWKKQLDVEASNHESPMKRSTSSSSLNRSESASHLRPSINFKSPGLLNIQTTGYNSSSTKLNSGRMSAPLQSRKKSANYLNGENHESSDDESSLTDTEVSSSWNLRPVTPPRPNILRQIRRSSTSQTLPNSSMNRQSQLSPSKSRKPWDNFELRSSRSEYNLSLAGRDTTARNRNTTNAQSPNVWKSPSNVTVIGVGGGDMILNDKFDFSSSNPASIPITVDLVHHVVDELNHIATYAKKIYHRCSAAGNLSLCNLLVDGISKAYVNLSTVVPPLFSNGDVPMMPSPVDPTSSLPPENMIHTMNLLQQYSDRLVSMVEQRMTKENQAKKS